jgi:hypothetical protein
VSVGQSFFRAAAGLFSGTSGDADSSAASTADAGAAAAASNTADEAEGNAGGLKITLHGPDSTQLQVEKARAATYRAASADDKLAAAQLAITVGDSEAARRLGFPRNSIATWRAMLVEAQADKALNSEEKLAVYGDKRKRNNTEKMLALDDLLIAFFLSLRSEVRHEVVFGAYFNLFVFVATRVGQPCNDPHASQGALGEAVPRPC